MTQQDVTEAPFGSNNVIYWDWWGNQNGAVQDWEVLGAWCAAFVSWAYAKAGAPLPEIQKAGRPGFVGVPVGLAYALKAGEVVNDPQPGDIVFYSWYSVVWENGWPWVWYGGRWVTAGDHVGIVHHVEPGVIWSIEGNTSVNASQDNGGAVLLRNRNASQAVAFWRPKAGTIDTSQIVPSGTDDLLAPAIVPNPTTSPAPAGHDITVLEDNSMIHNAVERPGLFNYDGVDYVAKDIYYAPIDGTVLPGGKVAVHSAIVMAPEDPQSANNGHTVHLFKVGEKVVSGAVQPAFEQEQVTLATYGAWRLMNMAGRITVLHRPDQPTQVFVRELSYLV